MTGAATLGGTLNTFQPGFSVNAGDVMTLMSIGGTRTGTFSNVTDGEQVGTYGGLPLYLSYDAGVSGNNVALFSVSTPGSLPVGTAGPNNNAYSIGNVPGTGAGAPETTISTRTSPCLMDRATHLGRIKRSTWAMATARCTSIRAGRWWPTALWTAMSLTPGFWLSR